MNPRHTLPESSHPRTPKLRLAWCLWLLTPLALFGTRQAVEACGHPPDEQVQAERSRSLTPAQVVGNPDLVHDRLREKNPDYRNQAQFAMDPALGLVGDLSGGGIRDLSPLQGLPFGALDLKGLEVSDLTPLKGMPLVLLGLEDTRVTDLKPLAGLKLEKLYLNNTDVSDLKPLEGMPLSELMLVGTRVKDLRPLRGVPVQMLWLNNTPVTDISPIATCPLVSLTLEGTGVSDLRPLSKMSGLRRLHIGRTNVSDLTPLKGLGLTRLIFTPDNVRAGLDVVRNMGTLTELGTTLDTRMPPDQFWAQFDRGTMR